MGELWLVSGTGFTRVIHTFPTFWCIFWYVLVIPHKESWDFKKAGDSRLKTRGELRNLDHLRGGSQVFGMFFSLVILLFIPRTDPVKMNIPWYSWFMQFRFRARIHRVSRCPWELWGKPDGETVMDHVFGEETSTQQVTCCTCAEMETLQNTTDVVHSFVQ